MGIIDIGNRVINTDRRFGSAQAYYRADVRMGGKVYPALFTWAQLVDAMGRATANPEDIKPPRRWVRLLAWLRR